MRDSGWEVVTCGYEAQPTDQIVLKGWSLTLPQS